MTDCTIIYYSVYYSSMAGCTIANLTFLSLLVLHCRT